MTPRPVAAAALVLVVLTGPAAARAAEPAAEMIQARPIEDAWTRGETAGGWDVAPTGELRVTDAGMGPVLVVSPDSRWCLVGEPDESAGLDVAVLRLHLVSLRDGSVRRISDGAGSAQWSPNSRYVFVATGPHPYVYDLARGGRIVIENVHAGIENEPVWASRWSADGRELVVHRQQRWDEADERRAWIVRLQ